MIDDSAALVFELMQVVQLTGGPCLSSGRGPQYDRIAGANNAGQC